MIQFTYKLQFFFYTLDAISLFIPFLLCLWLQDVNSIINLLKNKQCFNVNTVV